MDTNNVENLTNSGILDLQKRVMEIESRQCFQEQTIHELNGEVYQQQQVIERLELKIDALKQFISSQQLPSNQTFDNNAEKPPHY